MEKDRRMSSCRKCSNLTCNGPRTDATGGRFQGSDWVQFLIPTARAVTCKMAGLSVACASWVLNVRVGDTDTIQIDTGCSVSRAREGIANETAGVPG